LEQASALRERTDVPTGEIEAAIAYLQHYECVGDRMLRLLAQEDRHPSLKSLMNEGRAIHRERITKPA
jgi:hypothetical protein